MTEEQHDMARVAAETGVAAGPGAVVVAGWDFIEHTSLQTWVGVATLLYTCLQIYFLIRRNWAAQRKHHHRTRFDE